MCSFVLTASPEFFKVSTPDKQQRFFRDFTNFFKTKYGEENVLSAIVHLDETNPHMHLNLIPIVDGKLCAKELFDGQLVKLQTEIWKEVGQQYGLERGKSGNSVEHLSTAEYKAKKILEEAESKKTETEDYAEALTQAEEKIKRTHERTCKGGIHLGNNFYRKMMIYIFLRQERNDFKAISTFPNVK